MDERRFDDLAKSMGSGASRRTLLKALGGGVAGAIAGLFVRRARAGVGGVACPPGWTACACVSSGCIPPGYTCLPGTASCVCRTANVCGQVCLPAPCNATQCLVCNPATGTCVSSCSVANCQTCNGAGQCVSTCSAAQCQICNGEGQCVSACTQGQTCVNGTCQNLGTCAGSPNFCDNAFPCGAPGCLCFNDAGGGGAHFCAGNAGNCSGKQACSNTSQCPPGFFCAGTCCGNYCFPLCGGTGIQVTPGTGPRTTLP